MKITVSKFNNMLKASNKNLEKHFSNIIRESSNAVLVSMYDDKLILADHESKSLYEADYSFSSDGILMIENYEPVELELDEASQLTESIKDYFDDKIDAIALAESYDEEASKDASLLESELTIAMAGKINPEDKVDYRQLSEAVASMDLPVKNSALFKTYSDRLSTNPRTSVKYFNWKDPVKIALEDIDEERYLSSNAKAKAPLLVKDKVIRSRLEEAAEKFVNEGDNSLLETFLINNSSAIVLDESELKELVSFSTIVNRSLATKTNAILSEMKKIISENEYLGQKKVLFESQTDSVLAEEAALEPSNEDVEMLSESLKTLATKVTDEKLIKKLNETAEKIEESTNEETDVSLIKEAVELLSL